MSNWKWIKFIKVSRKFEYNLDKLNKLDLELNWFGWNYNVSWLWDFGSLWNGVYPQASKCYALAGDYEFKILQRIKVKEDLYR